jgi:heparin binding hemagglutinin HbhA
MTEQQTKSTKIPAPLYAAAGAGDLAYQQLRKLPTVVGELGGRAVAGGFELREKAVASLKVATTDFDKFRDKASTDLDKLRDKASTDFDKLRDKATTTDLDKLRDKAASNAVAFAIAAQERAVAVYTALVSHGERVVGTGVVQAAETVNADIEATEAPKPVTATPADVAEVVEAKPRAKRTRPAAK